LLAENEDQTDFMKNGFDMNYAWNCITVMNSIAQGKDSVRNLRKYYLKERSIFPVNVSGVVSYG